MLVGRQTERQAIDRLVAAARLGASGALALRGEAGVGKTSLLEDAAARLGEMRVLRATGVESEREIPFGMLLQLLRPALGVIQGIPPVQADALSAALAMPTTRTAPARDRFTVGAGVLSLLCRYAEDGPVAVVVDDVNAADAPSVDALVFAARRLAADPIVVLLGLRSPEGDAVAAGLPSIALGGLDVAAARELLPRDAATDDQVRMLHRATGGNPLALLELGTADADVVESVETGLPLRVPRAVADAFARRLDGLDPAGRTALLAAAVCGGDLVLVTHACTVLGVDAADLDEAEGRGLIAVRGGRVEFRHPLLRAAVYSGGTTAERQRAHQAAADATPAADADRRAWHLAEATWHPDAGVARLLADAGDRAVARGAHAVASVAFERSAQLTPDPARRGERLLRAADTAWNAGGGARALELLDRWTHETAEAPATPDRKEVEVRASIAARSGSLRDALELLLLAADDAPSPDDEAVALADAVHATFYLGDARTASELADRLAAVWPSVADERARALGLMATGMARTLAGRGGADEIRAAVPLLESTPELSLDPRRLSWLLLAPLFLRDATSGARLRTLVDEVRGAAGVGALPAVLFHIAVDQSTTGATWPRAEANFAEAIHLAAETGQHTELAMSLAGLARLDARAGRAEACRSNAARARELCAARDIHVGEVWVGHAVGDLELSLGRAEAAAERFIELAALLERLGLDDADLSPAPELADALTRLGRRDDAREVAAACRDLAAAKGQPWALARSDRASGMVADEGEMDAWFSASLDRHAQTLDRFETARTRLAYGERLRRAGRRVDARSQLHVALDDFAALGAAIWRDRAAAELRATGEHVRATTVDAVAELTPQELQVSIMLADGRTTREAAAALFLSPKTVEYHLRKVYTKLGIASRAELAELLTGIEGGR